MGLYLQEWLDLVAKTPWTPSSIADMAKEHARQEGRELDIKDFWFLADHRWPGTQPTPRDLDGLAARAAEYIVLDYGIKNCVVNPDEMNVAASLKRIKNFEAAKKAGLITNKGPKDYSGLRWASQCILMFFSRELSDKFFVHQTHSQICNFFVQKSPLKRIVDQDSMKGRLLLFGRGTGKSTLDILDATQWMLVASSIRIMVLCGVKSLAEEFVAEAKSYFTVDEGAELTPLQELFPDYCIPAKSDGKKSELICPARPKGEKRNRDATLWASSILAADVGRHCDIIKGDDTVHEKNVEKPPLIEKVVRKIEKAENVLIAGGYLTLVGTPYAGNDLYARKLEYARLHPESRLVLRVPSLIRRPESLYKNEDECTEKDFFVTFPYDKYGNEMLTFKHLWQLRDEKPEDFKSQQLLDPHGIRKVSFTTELLQRQTITEEQLPVPLAYYILVDTANTDKAWSDYTVAIVAGIDQEGRAFIRDIYRAKSSGDTEKSKAIAELYHKYHPKMISIEDANGSRSLEPTIRYQAEQLGDLNLIFDWITPDRTKGSKSARIFALEPSLQQSKLFFVNTLSCMSDLYEEFRNFGTALHDDIPDAISIILRVLQNFRPDIPTEEVARREQIRSRDRHDIEDEIFRQMMENTAVETPIPEPELNAVNPDDEIVDYFNAPRMRN